MFRWKVYTPAGARSSANPGSHHLLFKQCLGAQQLLPLLLLLWLLWFVFNGPWGYCRLAWKNIQLCLLPVVKVMQPQSC